MSSPKSPVGAALVGTGPMVRLALRRDRILLPAWIVVFVATAAGSAAATVGLYPTVESRVQLATSANANPALLALYGWVFEPTSLGAVSMYKMIAFGSAMVAVLTIISTVRHTRAEEEAGRLELLGATVLGRYAALSAALIVSIGTSLLVGLLTALGLIGAGLPTAGSFAFGLCWAMVGSCFAVIAGFTAQLTANARTATGLACATLGAAYLLRAVGDSTGDGGPGWVSWLSPVGWSQQVRPYAGDRWWVLLVPVLFSAATIGGAYLLTARRDVGAGLFPDRLGPAAAPARLRSPLALAWRLQRGALLGWTLAFVVLGLVLGGVAASVGDLLDSPNARDMVQRLGGQQGLTDAFLAAELGIVGVIAAAYGVQAAMRLRSEEVALRAEPLLATGVSRVRWAGSHVLIALAGTVVLLTAAGAAAGLSHGAQVGMDQFGRVFGAALVQLPAALVLTGIVVAAFGLAPRLIAVGWVALAGFMVVGQFGPLLRLDQWVMDVSPFTHTPKLPGPALSAAPLAWLTVTAVVGVAAGLLAFRRRDVG